MKKIYLILGVIFLLGVLIRFYQLASVPVGFHRDEAFLGYNAYSILMTGKDMTGDFLPIHFASFLYSPGGYSYFSIPFISIFKLSVFSVRSASAFFGSITVVLLFFMVRELFSRYVYRNYLALLSSLFLAILPWHINLSRTATENTIVVFFIVLGIWLYLLWNRKKSILFLITSFVSFGITFFIYQAPRAFLPIFIPFLVIVFWTKSSKKSLLLIVALFIITTILPLLFILKSPQLSLRLKTLNVLSTEQTQLQLEEQIREDGVKATHPIISRAFSNKILNYSGVIWNNYIDHFSYKFLFTDSGYPDRYRIANMGLLYIYMLPLIIFGMWQMLYASKREFIFIFGLLLIAPIGSALTYDDIPNLQRSLLMVIPCVIFTSYGFIEVIQLFSKRKFVQIPLLIVLIIFIVYGFCYYIHDYYTHGVLHRPWYRQEGYTALVTKIKELSPSYQKIIVTDKESSPTIFFLFYNSYDPASFQSQTKNSTMRDFDRVNFSSYEFSQEECPVQLKVDKEGNKYITAKKGILYVNSGVCKPVPGTKELDVIRRSDGSAVFRILAIQ